MKKLLFVLPLVAMLGCGKEIQYNKEEVQINENLGEPLVYKSLESSITEKITQYLNDSAITLSKNFDFENLSFTSSPDNPNLFGVILREENASVDDYLAVAFLFDEDSTIFSFYYLNTQIDGNLSEVSFLDEDMNFQWKMNIDMNSLTYTVDNSLYKASTGCGAKVAECIQDAYLEDGWGSVVLWLGSAFVPELSVAVAIVCIRQVNC